MSEDQQSTDGTVLSPLLVKLYKQATQGREFMHYWFDLNQTTLRGLSTNPNNFGTCFLDYKEFFRRARRHFLERKMAPISKDELIYAFNAELDFRMQKELPRAMEGLLCTAENLEPLRDWIKALTGRVIELDVRVMAHWMWQIKRKSLGLRTKHQLMPIIYGPQGAGKSWALTFLLKPIENYRKEMNMRQLGDERVFPMMAQNLVAVFDELEGVDRADISALKKQITNDKNSYRKLHSHFMVDVEQNCSLIGTTNQKLNEQIIDHTGNRRFYEITSARKSDEALLDAIDYSALWQGIDERLDNGYTVGEYFAQLKAFQIEHLTQLDPAKSFAMYAEMVAHEGDSIIEVSSEMVYKAYQTWAKEEGNTHRQMQRMTLTKKLKNNPEIRCETRRVGRNGEMVFFMVPETCKVENLSMGITQTHQTRKKEDASLEWSMKQ